MAGKGTPQNSAPDAACVTAPTDAELLRRRAAALKLRAEGRTQTYIAKRLNVSQPTVSSWLRARTRKRAARTFADPLAAAFSKPPDGRPPLVTDDQLRAILAAWPVRRRVTGNAFRQAIRDTHGVRYSLSHACGLLRYLRGIGVTRFEARHAELDALILQADRSVRAASGASA